MFESANPDTFAYLLLALSVVSIIAVLFIGSMVIRYRNFQRDLKTLEGLDEK